MAIRLTDLSSGEDALRFMFAFPVFFEGRSGLPEACRKRDRYPSETTFVGEGDVRKKIRYVHLREYAISSYTPVNYTFIKKKLIVFSN